MCIPKQEAYDIVVSFSGDSSLEVSRGTVEGQRKDKIISSSSCFLFFSSFLWQQYFSIHDQHIVPVVATVLSMQVYNIFISRITGSLRAPARRHSLLKSLSISSLGTSSFVHSNSNLTSRCLLALEVVVDPIAICYLVILSGQQLPFLLSGTQLIIIFKLIFIRVQLLYNVVLVSVRYAQLLSHVQLFGTPWTAACQAPLSMGNLQARILELGCYALLQGIFPSQGSNPGLPLCRQILYLPSEPPGKPMLVSAVQQSESTICMHLPPPFWISFPFRSAQNTEYSFLCYIVGSHQLSILYKISIVYICQSQTPNSSHLSFSSWYPYICSLSLCLYLSFTNKIIYTIFINSTYMYQYTIIYI